MSDSYYLTAHAEVIQI